MTPASSHEPKPSARCAQIARGFLVCAFPAVVFLIALTAAAGQRADRGGDGRSGAPKTTGVAGAGLGKFDQIMLETLRDKQIRGASLAISKDGSLVFARGYGLANVETNEPVQPTSLFNLASCTKPFTGVAILKLVDEGKLNLDDHVFRLLADVVPSSVGSVDPRIHKITVRQVLHHSAGFPHDPKGRKKFPNLRELVRENLRQPLEYAPGTQTRYSNFGFLVLRLVVDQTAGEGYEQYVTKSVLRPIGITDMCIDPEQGYLPNEVRRYTQGGNHLVAGGHGPVEGEGGWLASTIDVVRFLNGLDGTRGKGLLSPHAIHEMLSAPAPPVQLHRNGSHNGLGWDVVRPTPAGPIYNKNGGIPGIATFMEHLPHGVDWAVAFNGNGKDNEGQSESTERRAPPWQAIKAAIEATSRWPTADFSSRYP
jgi:CubicO group peptidase (beta-lactamase class C family)